MYKICNKCSESVHRNNFYANKKTSDGLSGKCKDCAKILAKKNRENNKEYYLQYDRARANEPKRVAGRLEYAKKPQVKERKNKLSKEWVKRNPKKRSAHIAVSNALRDGKIHKQPCKSCGSLKVQAHHNDYTLPLVVEWLCVPCHSTLHATERDLKILPIEDRKKKKNLYESQDAN